MIYKFLIKYLFNLKIFNYFLCFFKFNLCKCLLIIFLVSNYSTKALSVDTTTKKQQDFYQKYIAWPDTLNKRRYKAVSIGSGVLLGGTLYFLNDIWYSQYPRGKFKTFNDLGEWQQVDKVGHVYSSMLASKLFTTFFRWTGTNERKSVLLGAGGGFAYQSIIEILDGHSQKWGFSWGDMGANTAGCLLYGGQQLLWHEQRVVMKYSWHIQDYETVELLRRANNLYGASVPERIFKDYNAQTYWLSANINSFMPKTKLPKWINLAVGYGAQNMYGGYENIERDDFGNIVYLPNGTPSFDRRDIPRYRQFYFSPDIDWSRIPWKSKFLKDFFKLVNLKLPFPSLEYNTLGQWKVNPLHF
jgi:hypothetical protein